MIANILISFAVVVMAVFFLGLCIFVHELGHFLVALWRGMYIERFSIGFGRKIWGFRRGDVEFIVSALPLGGYVALPQLEPTDEPRDEQGNPLPPALPTDRILTAIAGPLSNIVFGFFLAAVLWAVKMERPMPMDEYQVAKVPQEMPGGETTPEYAAGLRSGDTILKVNGEEVPESPQRLIEKIIYPPAEVRLTIRRNGRTESISYTKAANPKYEGLPYPFFDVRVPVVAAQVQEELPAGRAGIKKGDQFVAIDGDPVDNPRDFVESIRATEGEKVDIKVRRGDETMVFPDIEPVERQFEGKAIHIIGVAPAVPRHFVRVTPWRQFVEVMSRTRKTLQALVTPRTLIGPRHMSGPVGIISAQYQMFRLGGLRYGLSFVVLVTFNLAVLNILPIPVLDGGHLVFGLVEGLSGRRIPARGARILQTIFAILLISLITYITFFDIKRFFPGDDEPAQGPQQEEPADAPAENRNSETKQKETIEVPNADTAAKKE